MLLGRYVSKRLKEFPGRLRNRRDGGDLVRCGDCHDWFMVVEGDGGEEAEEEVEEEEEQRGGEGWVTGQRDKGEGWKSGKRSPSVYWVSSLPDSLELRGE